MNTMELLTQMACMAGQIAQSTLPEVGGTSGPAGGGKSEFQTMLEDKYPKQPDTSAPKEPKPATDGAAQEQPREPGEMEMDERQRAELAAALMAPGMSLPAVVMSQSGLTGGVVPSPRIGLGDLPVEGAQVQIAAEGEPAQLPMDTPQAAVETAPVSKATVEGPVQLQPEQPQLQADAVGAPREGTDGDVLQAGGKERKPEDGDAAVLSPGGETAPFREVDSTPVKVGDGAALDTTSDQFEAKLSRTIADAMEQGRQQVEIRLSPEHLGSVTVEMTRDAGGSLHVVLRPETEQAARLLREHAPALGLMLQDSAPEVRIEVGQSQPQENHWQQGQQQGRQGGQQQQGQHPQREDPEKFLHQLRLGLIQEALA